jgi:hypothetical protein
MDEPQTDLKDAQVVCDSDKKVIPHFRTISALYCKLAGSLRPEDDTEHAVW